ncbi:hypothetical protein DESUT3_26770 [Desulfuromonas versatilis]|uniref:Uncharacterized protein n=1 Tax=Desulfuromonas versatilis TaxID=2802975 RepID=A0ABM8HUD0_9BACT|nr:hypothetical protein [Desulfuromonas versatilis]BCR05608.1 hypothetical protein DESUT3_26770 [Desulfuromonas versatilis]
MNEIALEERISRLEKELLLASDDTERRVFELRMEVDRLKLEVAALRNFLGTVNPSFAEQFPQILDQTIREVNPESD